MRNNGQLHYQTKGLVICHALMKSMPRTFQDSDLIELNMSLFWPKSRRPNLMPPDRLEDRDLASDVAEVGKQVKEKAINDMVKYMKTHGTAPWKDILNHLKNTPANYPSLTDRQWIIIKDHLSGMSYIERVAGEDHVYRYLA
jgi:hypothetical protein